MRKFLTYSLLLVVLFTFSDCKSSKKGMIDPPKAVAVNPATGESPKSLEEQLMLTEKQGRGKKKQYAKDKISAKKRHQKEVKKYQQEKNSKYSKWLIKQNNKHARKYNRRFGRRRKFFLWRWLGI